MTQSDPVVVQGTPVVVQGTPVAAPTYTQQSTQVVTDGNWEGKGEKQATRCRDPIFALLLYGNVAAIAVVAALYGQDAFQAFTTGGDYVPYMYAILICSAFSVIFSGIMYLVMMRFPQTLIKSALIFVVVLSGVWAILAFVSGSFIGGIFGVIFFLIGICYARAVWSRIPFATANLVTACTAIKANCGVTMEAYFFALVAFGWSLLWGVALFGVWEQTYRCTTNAQGVTTCDINYGYLFLLFLSYFFTHQVIQNTLQVSVVGAVGTYIAKLTAFLSELFVLTSYVSFSYLWWIRNLVVCTRGVWMLCIGCERQFLPVRYSVLFVFLCFYSVALTAGQL